MQTRLGSLTEATTTVAIGFGVAYMSNLIVLPIFGYDVGYSSAAGIAVIFTVISLVRSYLVRRMFNYLQHGSKANAPK